MYTTSCRVGSRAPTTSDTCRLAPVLVRVLPFSRVEIVSSCVVALSSLVFFVFLSCFSLLVSCFLLLCFSFTVYLGIFCPSVRLLFPVEYILLHLFPVYFFIVRRSSRCSLLCPFVLYLCSLVLPYIFVARRGGSSGGGVRGEGCTGSPCHPRPRRARGCSPSGAEGTREASVRKPPDAA